MHYCGVPGTAKAKRVGQFALDSILGANLTLGNGIERIKTAGRVFHLKGDGPEPARK